MTKPNPEVQATANDWLKGEAENEVVTKNWFERHSTELVKRKAAVQAALTSNRTNTTVTRYVQVPSKDVESVANVTGKEKQESIGVDIDSYSDHVDNDDGISPWMAQNSNLLDVPVSSERVHEIKDTPEGKFARTGLTNQFIDKPFQSTASSGMPSPQRSPRRSQNLSHRLHSLRICSP